jgi:hypothetical protein
MVDWPSCLWVCGQVGVCGKTVNLMVGEQKRKRKGLGFHCPL